MTSAFACMIRLQRSIPLITWKANCSNTSLKPACRHCVTHSLLHEHQF